MIKSFEYLRRKDKLRVAGLMSGTSADGVDAVIVDVTPSKTRLLGFGMYGYPKPLRESILKLCRPQTARLDDVCHYNFLLGEIFAESIAKLCKNSGIALSSIDLVGSHGQTICHLPKPALYGNRKIRSTLQIGEPSVIAQRLGITTVADFRCRDMAAAGEGAPLVPYADLFMFGSKKLSRAIQNIGGIANVTYLPAVAGINEVIAFDTGPGNMIIDWLAAIITKGRQNYDRNGRLAALARVSYLHVA